MQLLRAALITLLLLGAIMTLVPENPASFESAAPDKTLAVGEVLAP